MGDFFFVVKCLVITVALVFLMQIKVGDKTLEQHSMTWLHQSTAAENLRLIASGAIRAFKVGSDATVKFVDQNVDKIFGERASR
jgi:hypothetical protein